MARERAEHTLQATALVNEAYMRLIDVRQVRWQNRAHFFAMSARLMRRILVDFARSRRYQKRGGGAQKVTLDEALVVSPEPGSDLVALDEALVTLAAVDEPEGAGGGNAIFRRAQRRGNGGSAARLARYGHARLEAREGVAPSRAQSVRRLTRRASCRLPVRLRGQIDELVGRSALPADYQARTDGVVPVGTSLKRTVLSRCADGRSTVRVNAVSTCGDHRGSSRERARSRTGSRPRTCRSPRKRYVPGSANGALKVR